MKKSILTLLTILSFIVCKAQTKLAEIKSFDAITILANVTTFKPYRFENYSVMTYIFDNESGSAHEEGTDTVSSSILIIKSEYGEHEIPKFYLIKNLIAPKIITIKENEITVKVANGKVAKKYTF